jgi:hypothetical protein
MPEWLPKRVIALAGQCGVGKDTLYECLLKPRGYLRWQMTLHYKVWLVSTRRFTWEDVFDTKPTEVRQVLQEEITAERYKWGETIWLGTFLNWLRALHDIVGIDADHVAITDMRFLTEMAGVKALGGRIVHIESIDQQANIDPLLRTHRSEMELTSPEMRKIRDGYIFNDKSGILKLRRKGWEILRAWDWL